VVTNKAKRRTRIFTFYFFDLQGKTNMVKLPVSVFIWI